MPAGQTKISQEALVQFAKEKIAEELKIEVDEVDTDTTFASLGLDSITCIFFMEQIENYLDIRLNPIDFWDYPTVNSYVLHLMKTHFPQGNG
ncbi:MAG: acyl carrier protein [Bacteroidota bacterium]